MVLKKAISEELKHTPTVDRLKILSTHSGRQRKMAINFKSMVNVGKGNSTQGTALQTEEAISKKME